LYTAVRHLIVTGNVLLFLDKESMRVMGLRYFCVKRTADGRVHTLVVREVVQFNELDENVKEACAAIKPRDDDGEVSHYRYIRLQANGDYTMTQWVDEQVLPAAFDGKWPADKMPYRVLTWDLSDESDYATGLVEEYAGDFEALSALAESTVEGAILGTEFRWLVAPTGLTSADDLNKSVNGDALAGTPGDIAPTQAGNPQAVQMALEVMNRWEQRVARGFLMQSAVTRDAERVTAEEVRLTAQELETAFGGAYSTLAAGMQMPVAYWLLTAVGTDIKGTDLKVAVITGLEALSRSGDLENLRLALGDLAAITTLPEGLQARLKFKELAAFVGQGRGIDLAVFLKDEEQYQQEQAELQQQRVAEAAATATGEAAGAAQGQAAVQGQSTP
jgi:hypothetical protein